MATKWTTEEQQAVADEGVRLWSAGKASSLMKAFDLAQSVIPKARRRTISTTSKVPWFVSALRVPKKAPDQPQSAKPQQIATESSLSEKNASEGESASRRRVVWSEAEQKLICTNAARLLHDLQANGPRDAMEKAQLVVLPPERQRHIASMTTLAGWYPDGLKHASAALRRELDKAAQAKARDEAAAAAAAAQPVAEVQALPAVVTPTTSAVASIFGDWTHIREHLVQEIASLVAEGIHRGLASVQLAAPQDTTPARHTPFVVDPHPKIRPPSVLVAGLKDATASQIKAEFGSKLDLRFITPDKSKDQLRQMTEQAETTIAVTDFLSHSHTDIIKARSKHHVECSGGMTSLRQHLANIAGLQLNGSSAHAG